MRHLHSFVAALFALTFSAPIIVLASSPTAGMTVGNFQFVSENRDTRTLFFETYQATLSNPGAAMSNVTATVSSTSPSVSIVPGQNVLQFSPVPANSQVLSSNTFTIIIDRTQPFSFSSLQFTFDNPVANAGPDQTAKVNSTVTLNGSASSNPSGQGTLTYSWAFSAKPAGSNATLSNATAIMPTFVVDAAGTYAITLTVSNGLGSSSATVSISTVNSPPVANAGPNQTVSVGSTVALDGGGSSDADGSPLSFAWELISAPTGSSAFLSNYQTSSPSFVADQPGTYVAQLVVTADGLNSAPVTVTITTKNTPPIANAGHSQVVSVGATVQLDGSGSTDVNGNPLTFQWSFVATPIGSDAVINNPTAVKPTFLADVAGSYIVQLIVNDGAVNSVPSTVAITTNVALPPTANAGPNQSVALGALVQLSGSGKDPQGLPLTYAWSLIMIPSGSSATLSNKTIANPTFYADLPGTYIAQLIVSDSSLSSSPATVTITTAGTAPVANPGPNQSVLTGSTVTLNGSASTDSNGNPLSYSWTFTSIPSGSTASLLGANTVSPSFVADLAGVYVAQLIVNDGVSNSAPKTVTITATPPGITLSPNPVNLVNSPVVVTVSINPAAGGNGLTVNLSGFDDKIISVPGSVTIPSRGSSATFTIIPQAPGSTIILASSAGYQSGETTVNVGSAGITLALSAPGVGVGRSINGTVTLSSPAPAGGTTVALSSSPSNLATFNPASVAIAQGKTSGTFSVTGEAAGTATLTASASGYGSGTATLLIANLGVVSLQKNVTVAPGQSAPISVTLSSPAPPDGVTVTLVSSDINKVKVTSSVVIPAGATVPTTTAQVTGVNFGSANIMASATSYTSDTESVNVVASISFSPKTLSLVAGASGNLTLDLSVPSPSPLSVTVSSSNTGVATVTPATYTIAANATSVSIPVTAVGPGTSTITAAAAGFANATATVTVTGGGSITLPSGISLTLGQSAAFPITLSTPAPASGVVVMLSSSDPSKVSISPSSVSILSGATTPLTQPQITGLNFGSASITASASGFTSATQTVSVKGSLTLAPSTLSVGAGSTKNLTLTLSAAAPTGGVTVSIGSGTTTVATVPSSVTILAGATSVSVPVAGLIAGSSVITASAPNLSSASATVTVTGGVDMIVPATLTLSPGDNPVYNIVLAKAPANAVTVTLTVSDTSKVTVSTNSVSFNAGSTTPTRSVTITAVAPGTATITASAPGLNSAQTQVTVAQTATLTPQTLTITGVNSSGNLTVTLSSPAPSAVTFTLKSTNPAVATVPSSLPFSTGTQSLSFKVTAVGAGSTTIQASASGYTAVSSAVTVVQAGAIALSLGSPSIQLQNSTTLTITLPSAAPFGGESVTLGSNNANISLSPAVVIIPQGSATGTAMVTGTDVGSATITATSPDFSAAQPVTVKVGATIAWADKTLIIPTLNTQVQEGLILSATVPKGATGIPITVTSSNTNVVTVQSPVNFFWDGSNMPTTKVTITSVGSGTAILTASGTNIPPVTLSVTVTGPVSITTAALPNGVANSAYSFTVQAAGGLPPYKWSATGLPSPLVINSSTGQITGTPTAASSGTVKITVSDSTTPTAQTTSATLSLTISAAVPTTLTAIGGTPQSAVINKAFASPLQVLLKDANGNPLPGATIGFSAPASGPSGTFAGGLTSITATTDSTGKASVPFTANSSIGSYLVTASINALKASFSLTNTIGTAVSITATSGTPQSVQIGTAFAALVATVKDSSNNPVPNVTVTFAAPASGASGTFIGGSSSAIATTNASGVATAPVFTANKTKGSYQVSASAAGVATPATFSLTNTTGPANAIVATSGSGQSTKIGTAFASPLVATVTDAGNNPVAGATVTFGVPGSGASGTFAGGVNTATTNSSGIATSPVFTANNSAGSYSVTASVSGVATKATFNLTNTSSVPGSITATSGTPQSVQINTAFAALVATVKDSGGNPVANVTVTFAAPASGASGTFTGGSTSATATTNVSGVATAPTFTANKTAGAYVVNATAPGVATAAPFSLTNTHGVAAAIVATSGSGQSTKISTAFGSPLVATVTDAGNNPVGGVVVTFAAPASGAGGTFAGGLNTATSNASGVATSAIFTANGTAGGPYSVSASVAGVATKATFSLTNTPGTPGSITATSGTPQSVQINTAFAALVATVKDSGGNPVANVTVTFAAPASGASGTFTGGSTSATATTNASGVATAPTFTANKTAGAYVVNATAPGVATAAPFSLTNKVGPANAIVATSGSGQSTKIGTAFASPLVATVTDAGNNPVAGATVTFGVPGSGASGTFAGGVNTATTNSSGIATSPVFTANNSAGSYSVTASVSGVATKATFNLTNTSSVPGSITATSGTPQSVQINTAFAALVATVKDSGGNPVANVTVTFAAPASGASGTFTGGSTSATATTNVSGVATAPTFTANKTAGAYVVNATAPGVATAAPFSLTNTHGVAAAIVATSGSGQSTKISTAFGSPLVATVTDAGNNPVGGVVVTFAAPASGAGGTFAGGLNTATSNASGVATSAIFTANGTAGGPYSVSASVAGVATKATFSLTNTPGTPGSITATSGTPQSVQINTAFAALVATVKDSGGNPVANVTVTFAAPASGASGTFTGGSTSATATTNASGVATAPTFTANKTAGAYVVNATAPGVATAAPFSLTNKVGPANAIVATSGSGQSTKIGTAFASPLVATVTDAGNNPVAGATVTFGVPGSGASGTFAGGVNTATTNSSGVATSAVFTANATTGTYSVSAAVAGVTPTASFSLTNTPLPPASIVAIGGTPQTASVGTAFGSALQALVKDANSNPISNVAVTFTAPATTGPSGTFPGGVTSVTAITNAAGTAVSPVFTADLKAGGPYTVTATVSGLASTASFSLTNVAGTPASITIVSGSPQSAQVNTAFTSTFVVVVKDNGGNPVDGATVTLTPPATGASGAFAGGANTARTDATGTATSSTFTANTVAGSYSVTASIGGLAKSFSLTNAPGPATSLAIVSGTPQSASINAAFAAPFVVVVKDAFSNPVSGDTVTFKAPSTGVSGSFPGGITTTAVTSSSGTATSPTFTANSTKGAYTVTATLNGTALTANFSLTNNPGSPNSITVSAGNNQGTVILTPFPTALAVLVQDSGKNAISGQTVTFTVVPSNGAGATFAGGTATAQATTNSSGIATAPALTAGSVSGVFAVTAALSSLPSLSTQFTLTNQPGTAHTVTILAGNNQSANTGAAFANPLQVKVTDIGGNAVRAVSVTFVAPASGPSATFAGDGDSIVVQTDNTGVATSSTVTANATGGGPYNVTASASGATPATFSLSNIASCSGTCGSISVTNATIGQNLQAPITIMLNPPAPTDKFPVTITSSNGSLAAPGASGQASETVTIGSGTTSFAVSIEAFASSGTVTFTVSAANYQSVTSTITLAKSAFVVSGPNGIGQPFSAFQGSATALTVNAGYLDSNGNFAGGESLRGTQGYSVPVPITSSNISVGTLQDCSTGTCKNNITSVTFTADQTSYSGINFLASSSSPGGSTTNVSVGTPAGFSAASSGNTITATLQQATAVPFNVTVGQNLQESVSFGLNAPAPTGGVSYTLQSADPTQVVFSTSPSMAGTGSLDITIPSGHTTQNGPIWVQVFANSGTVNYTAVSNTTGYPDVTGTVTLAPSGIVITSLGVVGASSFTENLTQGPVPLTFSTYQTGVSGNAVIPELPVPGILPLAINLTNTNSSVGTINPTSLSITSTNVSSGDASATSTFTPVAQGSTTIAATAAGFATGSVTANVTNTKPSILFQGGDQVIGNGLQSQYSIQLTAAAPAGGLAVTIQTSGSGNVLLSPDGIAAGKPAITVNVPATKTTATFYVQGVQNSGADAISVSAPGYTSPTAAQVTLTNAGFIIYPLGSTSVSLASGSTVALQVSTELLNADGSVNSGTDEGPVASVIVPVTDSSSSVATAPTSVTFTPTTTTVNVTVTPKATGSTKIGVTAPAGFTTSTSNTSVSVTVTP